MIFKKHLNRREREKEKKEGEDEKIIVIIACDSLSLNCHHP